MMAAPVGFATGYEAAVGVRGMAEDVRRAEDRGYDVGFFSETNNLMRDGVSAMAAMALATRRMTLGFTQIVRLRSPVVMAQSAATLDELTGGRIVLCAGACTRGQAVHHGLPELDPPRALAEWVEAIRLLLTGDAVTYAGEVVRLNGVRLGWTPVRRRVPIWIAAMSPTGLRLAGRIGDGVLLNAVSSPEYTANAVAILREAVRAAGRSWDDFEVAQIVNCSVEDGHEAAIDAIRWEVASKFHPGKPSSQIGPRTRVGEPHIHEEDLPLLREAYERGGLEGVTRAFPASWIEGLTASGTPDEVVRRVARYREAGVTLPILRPAARRQAARLIELFAPQ
ncbi:MAG TPA: LLM class flavin-dependent oxidoreductase [bacterium]|nr:LLM class flavin-dependent oxidoreductase [bacterium]